MAVPKKKTSFSKKRMRHAHSRLAIPGISLCSNCGHAKQPHAVCQDCGHYKKRLVVPLKESVADKENQTDVPS